jgi:hypothetical protein
MDREMRSFQAKMAQLHAAAILFHRRGDLEALKRLNTNMELILSQVEGKVLVLRSRVYLTPHAAQLSPS